MLRVTTFCEKCNKEATFSSVWEGEPFHCNNGSHIKIFEPAIGHCKKCNAEIEFDAATATYILNGKREVACPWDLCQECDP